MDLTGKWDGRTLTLREDFVFDDGTRDTKTWRFVKTGPGSVILTADSSGLSGPILIADGALEIDGKLNGPVDIGREVVLAGVGQLGTTTLYPTAVIAPEIT